MNEISLSPRIVKKLRLFLLENEELLWLASSLYRSPNPELNSGQFFTEVILDLHDAGIYPTLRSLARGLPKGVNVQNRILLLAQTTWAMLAQRLAGQEAALPGKAPGRSCAHIAYTEGRAGALVPKSCTFATVATGDEGPDEGR